MVGLNISSGGGDPLTAYKRGMVDHDPEHGQCPWRGKREPSKTKAEKENSRKIT